MAPPPYTSPPRLARSPCLANLNVVAYSAIVIRVAKAAEGELDKAQRSRQPVVSDVVVGSDSEFSLPPFCLLLGPVVV